MDIKVAEDLWASSMLPEGIVERLLVDDGAVVNAGDRIAELKIEDALHEVIAPVGGRIAIRTWHCAGTARTVTGPRPDHRRLAQLQWEVPVCHFGISKNPELTLP